MKIKLEYLDVILKLEYRELPRSIEIEIKFIEFLDINLIRYEPKKYKKLSP